MRTNLGGGYPCPAGPSRVLPDLLLGGCGPPELLLELRDEIGQLDQVPLGDRVEHFVSRKLCHIGSSFWFWLAGDRRERVSVLRQHRTELLEAGRKDVRSALKRGDG